jgi:hypothetical protein
MNQMLIMNQLSRLARGIEELSWKQPKTQLSDDRLHDLLDFTDDEGADKRNACRATEDQGGIDEMAKVVNPDDTDPYSGGLSSEQKQRINDLLGEWEDPQGETSFDDVRSSSFRVGINFCADSFSSVFSNYVCP